MTTDRSAYEFVPSEHVDPSDDVPENDHERYRYLRRIFADALDQAQSGKGKDRHALPGENFQDQQIVKLCLWMQSNHGDIFQAAKKAIESTRMEYAAARHELLGAINYLAAAVITLDLLREQTRK